MWYRKDLLPPFHVVRSGYKSDRCVLLCGFFEDSVILDFEWFANSSDYAFTEQGEAWYEDFGWNPELFPSPAQQLKTYLLEPWSVK